MDLLFKVSAIPSYSSVKSGLVCVHVHCMFPLIAAACAMYRCRYNGVASILYPGHLKHPVVSNFRLCAKDLHQ